MGKEATLRLVTNPEESSQKREKTYTALLVLPPILCFNAILYSNIFNLGL
jgi:hypothetical protein